VHLQNFPEKSCTPRIAKTTCWNTPRSSTSTILGNASASDAATTRAPRNRFTSRSGLNARATRNARIAANASERANTANTEAAVTAPSMACQGSRAYAPGCAMKPMAMIFTTASHEKNTAKHTSRCDSAMPSAESSATPGFSAATSADETRITSTTHVSKVLSKATMKHTRRNALFGENRNSDRDFMNTGGGVFVCASIASAAVSSGGRRAGRRKNADGTCTTTSRSGTPSKRRLPPKVVLFVFFVFEIVAEAEASRGSARSSVVSGANASASRSGGMDRVRSFRSRSLLSTDSARSEVFPGLAGPPLANPRGTTALWSYATARRVATGSWCVGADHRSSNPSTNSCRRSVAAIPAPAPSSAPIFATWLWPYVPASFAATAAPSARSDANARRSGGARPAAALRRVATPRARAAATRAKRDPFASAPPFLFAARRVEIGGASSSLASSSEPVATLPKSKPSPSPSPSRGKVAKASVDVPFMSRS
jgi:hypothetical protein